MIRELHGVVLRSERGQAIVEFAFVGSILLLILFAIFDLGRAIFHYNVISNAAREGARVGIISSKTRTAICTMALHAAASPYAPGVTCDANGSATAAIVDGTVTVAVPQRGTQGSATNPVQVTVTYAFRPINPVFLAISNTISMTASSSMYVE